MNYLKFLFFALSIFLESCVFPKYLSSFLKMDSIAFYCAVVICFYTKFNFRKYNKLIVLAVVLFDLWCGFELVNIVHNKTRHITDIAHYVFILSFLMIPFIFYDDQEAYSQIKSSNFFVQFFNFIITTITVCFFSAHFKWLHYPSALNENFTDWKQLVTNWGVDYVVFFNAITLTFLIKFYYSKSKKKTFLIEILKRVLLLTLITVSFYLIYNLRLSGLIKNNFDEWVPQPHNLIISNSLPGDLDTRFRLLLTTLIYSIL
jgi:hypothetical protein